MKIKIPDISKQIHKEDTLSILESKYSTLGSMWVSFQLEWMVGIYSSFKDHNKFLILIYLINKTLDFYSKNFIKLSFDEFYGKDLVEIGRFNIAEIATKLNIPKESARRKVCELEAEGVIRKNKKTIVIDRSKFYHTKPENSIKKISRFLATLSEMCMEEKILSKKITSEEIEITIKNNFSYIWKIYYEFQIPMMIKYKKIFNDLECFNIFGACVVNQHLFAKKISVNYMHRNDFLNSVYTAHKMQGVNAMSISDITSIPRATVIRKLKNLVSRNFLKIDEKKHYRLTGNLKKTLNPLQKTVLSQLANFSAQIYNLKILEIKKFDEYKDVFHTKNY